MWERIVSDLIKSLIDTNDLDAALIALQGVTRDCEYPIEIAAEIAEAFRYLPNDDVSTEGFVKGAVDLLLQANKEYGETSAEAWVSNYLPAVDIIRDSQRYDITMHYAALLRQVTILSYCEEEWAGKKILERTEEIFGHAHEVAEAIREWEHQNEYL
jgi:hypothetical protein